MAQNNLKQLFDTIKGITMEFQDDSERGLTALIGGLAQQFIPKDTGHMLHQTGFEKRNGHYFLYTNTSYANSQYWEDLYHLIEGGEFKSISRARAGISPIEAGEVEGLRGSEKHDAVYWRNYHELMDAGKLTKKEAKWFHRAAQLALDPAKAAFRKSWLEKARKSARSGNYYSLRRA